MMNDCDGCTIHRQVDCNGISGAYCGMRLQSQRLSRRNIAQALVLFLGSIGLMVFVLAYHPEPAEPQDTRLAAPAGGFAQVRTLYMPDTREWHIKRIGSEVAK